MVTGTVTLGTFTLEISYSQVAVFNASLDRPFNHWTEEHFKQGFVWRPSSVSFRTAARTGRGEVAVRQAAQRVLRDDASIAISVPFKVESPAIEVASVFKGCVINVDPGDYELVYQTGAAASNLWIDLQFVPGVIDRATILRGTDSLDASELVMTGEPA